MRNLIATIGLIYVTVAAIPCYAEDYDGNSLLDKCSGAESDENKNALDLVKGSNCQGLLTGIISMNAYHKTVLEVIASDDTSFVVYKNLLEHMSLFCGPSSATLRQTGRIVVKYLKDHPEKLHRNGTALAMEALQEAFPCNK